MLKALLFPKYSYKLVFDSPAGSMDWLPALSWLAYLENFLAYRESQLQWSLAVVVLPIKYVA